MSTLVSFFRSWIPAVSIKLTPIKMRRTTHFYVMVMSLFLLRLKGVLSDYTECKLNFDVPHTGHDCSNVSESWHNKPYSVDQILIPGALPKTATNEFNSSMIHSHKTLKMVAHFMYIKTSDENSKIQTHRKPSVHNIRTVQKAVGGRVVRLEKKSCNDDRRERRVVRRETRRTIQVPVARRTYMRREIGRRRVELSHQNEFQLRRDVRMNEIRSRGKSQRSYTREASLTVPFKPKGESINTRLEYTRRRRRQEPHKRREINDKRYTSRRYNEIIASAGFVEKSLTFRKIRLDERRKDFGIRNENRVMLLTDVRNSIPEYRERSETRDVQTRTRNAEQQRSTRENVFNNNENIAYSRREIAPKRNPRQRYDIARRSSRRSLGLTALPDSRRTVYTVDKTNDIFPRSTHYAQTVVKTLEFRQMPKSNKLFEDRQRLTGRRESRDVVRSKEIYDRRQSRLHARQTSDSRHTRRKFFRDIVHSTKSYGDNWIWSEGGISRAIVVGFVGILGRRLWQKQA